MDLRLRFLTAEIAILTAIAGLFSTNTAEWTKVYERRLYAEMALNLWRSGNEQKASEEACVPGMAPICETMVEAEDPRTPLAAAGESYSQPLAQNAESEAVNEQEAEKKILEESDSLPEALERVQQAVVPEPVETVQQAAPVAPDPESYVCSVSCNGDALDAGVSEYLKRRLTEAGIGWFFPYACAIAYQESSFNCLAVNQVNKLDMGLFQFRCVYWEENCISTGVACGDIFNPYLQIDVFTVLMARRLTQYGCSVYEAISRHKQSDFGTYDQEYVNQVMQHMEKISYGR